MASKRQIAANRRNARKSTGPRSTTGKRRASKNSYRHGLAASLASAERAEQVERLARMIAGDAADAITLEIARTAAAAECDLGWIRQIKVACINHLLAFGDSDAPQIPRKIREVMRFVKTGMLPKSVNGAAPMPAEEPARTAEAVRRALPQLLKLDRYARRAAARRDRFLLSVELGRGQSRIADLQNEANLVLFFREPRSSSSTRTAAAPGCVFESALPSEVNNDDLAFSAVPEADSCQCQACTDV
jgi:hypothetical protein